MSEEKYLCPHCGNEMKKWQAPIDSDWMGAIKYVCFEDECPYYKRGWKRMDQRYGAPASYRHSLNPETGSTGPMPVSTPHDLKPGIIE